MLMRISLAGKICPARYVSLMKPSPWMIPAVALLLGGAWYGYRKNTESALQTHIEELSRRIARQEVQSEKEKDRVAAADRKIDWKNLSRTVGFSSGKSMRDHLRIQRVLMTSPTEDLLSAFEALKDIPLSNDSYVMDILAELAKKDPQLVMRLAVEGMGDDPLLYRSAVMLAMTRLAESDASAAAASLDQLIAKGIFEPRALDGKNKDRTQMEGLLLGSLLTSDPATVRARLEALAEGEREEVVIQALSGNSSPEGDAGRMELIRHSVSTGKITEALHSLTSNLLNAGGKERVDAFLDRAQATPEEREQVVVEVMKNQFAAAAQADKDLPEALANLRAWAVTHAPDSVDSATGSALARYVFRDRGFEKTSALALQIQAETGSDAVLVSYLTGFRKGAAPKGAAALIDRIKDPEVREELRNIVVPAK
jgi:hypothetical protein